MLKCSTNRDALAQSFLNGTQQLLEQNGEQLTKRDLDGVALVGRQPGLDPGGQCRATFSIDPVGFLLQTTRPGLALVIRLEDGGPLRPLRKPNPGPAGLRSVQGSFIYSPDLGEMVARIFKQHPHGRKIARELCFGRLDHGVERARTTDHLRDATWGDEIDQGGDL